MPKFEAEFPVKRLAQALDVAGYEFDRPLGDESVVMEVEVGLTRMLGALASMGYINRRKKQSPGGTPPVTVPAQHTITSVSPSTATTAGGTTHTITGTGFISSAVVTLEGTNVTEAFVSSTSLTFTMPALAAGSYDVTVTQGGVSVTTVNAIVVSAPPVVTFAITGVSPSTTTTAGGTTHTITGTGFASNAAVRVGGTNTTETFVNSTTLTFVMPAKTAGTYNLTVTQSGDTVTLSNAIVVSAPPPAIHTITSVSPSTASTTGGTTHTITGTGFTGAAVVTLEGGVATTETFVNATTITFVMPAMALGTYDLIVTIGANAVTLSDALVVGVPGGSHPNEPGGFTKMMEHAFAAEPSGTNGTAGVSWYTFPFVESGDPSNPTSDNVTITADATDPTGDGTVLVGTYPSGLLSGYGPFNVGGTASPNESTAVELREMYWDFYFKMDGSDWQSNPVGQKIFGFASVGEDPAVRGNQIYWLWVGSEDGNLTNKTDSYIDLVIQNHTSDRRNPLTGTAGMFSVGAWHRVEMYFKLNTVGSTDGVFKMWVDGTLTHNITNFVWRTAGNEHGFRDWKFNPTFGGAGPTRNRSDTVRMANFYCSGIAL